MHGKFNIEALVLIYALIILEFLSVEKFPFWFQFRQCGFGIGLDFDCTDKIGRFKPIYEQACSISSIPLNQMRINLDDYRVKHLRNLMRSTLHVQCSCHIHICNESLLNCQISVSNETTNQSHRIFSISHMLTCLLRIRPSKFCISQLNQRTFGICSRICIITIGFCFVIEIEKTGQWYENIWNRNCSIKPHEKQCSTESAQ